MLWGQVQSRLQTPKSTPEPLTGPLGSYPVGFQEEKEPLRAREGLQEGFSPCDGAPLLFWTIL